MFYIDKWMFNVDVASGVFIWTSLIKIDVKKLVL